MRFLLYLFFLSSLSSMAQIRPSFYGVYTNKSSSSSGERTFTNCGATGKNGPSQSDCNTSYSSTDLSGEVTVSNGIQSWTAPSDGTYTIIAYGAQGGGSDGGKGAKISGEFTLTSGTVIKILVGQQGLTVNTSGFEASGGGGTFVTKSPHNDNNSILVVAGGGGGSWDDHSNSHGATGESGASGCCGNLKGGGGSSGQGGTGSGTCASDSGAGFLADANVLTHCGNGNERPALAYVNGGRGGENYWCTGAVGGFGGGGGTARCHNNTYTGGGGGGYSGGGMDYGFSSGVLVGAGGGGSKNNGSNTSNVAGNNTGHGKVEISW